jgi:ABC-type multidrug transport system fused ATPase/permease subunit
MALLLGLVMVGAVVLLLKWYVDADVKRLKASLRWTGVLLGLLLIVGLAATGRLGPALGMLVAFMAWLWRVFGWVQMLRQIGGMFGGWRFGRGGAGASRSDAQSAFLAMSLDHATGALDGEVLKGRFRGQRLSTLTLPDLKDMLTEVAAEPDSLSLLEAYMDRRFPEWREDPQAQANGRVSAPGLDEAEALRILGLAPGATPDDINAAYRRLMAQLHPDRGGSDYLAAKVNAARDLLLKG